jgi:hypothetical protein
MENKERRDNVKRKEEEGEVSILLFSFLHF